MPGPWSKYRDIKRSLMGKDLHGSPLRSNQFARYRFGRAEHLLGGARYSQSRIAHGVSLL
jgi:hypothetical protein